MDRERDTSDQLRARQERAADGAGADGEARLEELLARVYSDADAAAAFAADPQGEARRAGLPESVVGRLARIDQVGLALATQSFARKRAHKAAHAGAGRVWSWLRRRWSPRR
jgi:hypothetical protein